MTQTATQNFEKLDVESIPNPSSHQYEVRNIMTFTLSQCMLTLLMQAYMRER